MVAFDATESLTPFRDHRGSGEYGAILFDATQLRQVDPRWFDAQAWGTRAQAVEGSGRGNAWFIDASHGPCVLRQYLRGGMAARFSRDRYLWRGANRTRSFAEFRLLRELVRAEATDELVVDVRSLADQVISTGRQQVLSHTAIICDHQPPSGYESAR